MSEFTPGEWKAEKYCVWVGDRVVAQTSLPEGDQNMANAHLIAAAPNMHRVLKWLDLLSEGLLHREYQPGSRGVSDLVNMARAALAKAEGR